MVSRTEQEVGRGSGVYCLEVPGTGNTVARALADFEARNPEKKFLGICFFKVGGDLTDVVLLCCPEIVPPGPSGTNYLDDEPKISWCPPANNVCFMAVQGTNSTLARCLAEALVFFQRRYPKRRMETAGFVKEGSDRVDVFIKCAKEP